MTLPEVLALDPAQVRVMVAEKCGWTLRDRIFHNQRWQDVPTWFDPRASKMPADYTPAGQMLGGLPPDYCEDRNAIAQAAESLTGEEHRRYRNALWAQMSGNTPDEICRAYIEASALQRARAFLVGKSE